MSDSQSPWRGLYGDLSTTMRELDRRYGKPRDKNSIEQSLQSLMNDMGLGDYRVPVHLKSEDLPVKSNGQQVIGGFDPGTNEMTLYPSGYQDLSTGAHELGHAADEILGKYHPPQESNNPRSSQHDLHHKYYRDFNSDFGQQLEAQRSIEQGLGADPQDYQKFPWLSQVNPESSNLLANPWRFNHDRSEDPAWLWNLQSQK